MYDSISVELSCPFPSFPSNRASLVSHGAIHIHLNHVRIECCLPQILYLHPTDCSFVSNRMRTDQLIGFSSLNPKTPGACAPHPQPSLSHYFVQPLTFELEPSHQLSKMISHPYNFPSTTSAIAKLAVSPGDSIPNRLTKPPNPDSLSSSI
jgi:hypothetical protein